MNVKNLNSFRLLKFYLQKKIAKGCLGSESDLWRTVTGPVGCPDATVMRGGIIIDDIMGGIIPGI